MVLLPLLATGLVCSVLLTTSVYVQIIVVLVALIGVAGTLIGAVSDWLRHRKFYRGLERCAEHLLGDGDDGISGGCRGRGRV